MPPPLRYPSLHPPPLILPHQPRYIVLFTLIATLLFAQTALTACPEPSSQTDGATEQTEPSLEKVEVPEEATNPEESVQPEEGGPIEQEPTKENGPEPELERKPDTVEPYISGINGTGTAQAPDRTGDPNAPTTDNTDASKRIKDSIVITGGNLEQIEKWTLAYKDNSHPSITWEANETDFEKGSNMTTLKFSMTKTILAAGFFILTGTYGAKTVQAQIYVLQGEKGDTGAQGPKGDKGDSGLGFTQATVDFIDDLKTVVTIDKTNKTLTFKTDTITVEAQTFEAKGTNGTSLKVDDTNKNVIVEKANLHIRNGSSKTHQANSLGNVIIGYNDSAIPPTNPPFNISRTGSHNLVVGDSHSYTATGGLVAGHYNNLEGKSASILGGTENQAYSEGSSIVGGFRNKTGKEKNTAAPFYGTYSVVVGGFSNQTYGTSSSILGGEQNVTGNDSDPTKGSYSSISGGQTNTASGAYSSISGGQTNAASGTYSSISGGSQNTSSFDGSFICGGAGPKATTKASQVICAQN
ncbi:MAG: hypothetical protein H6727_02570 [Myxococcales bacterium]|nr:hypothetical protein [Myxococcales bacterium]